MTKLIAEIGWNHMGDMALATRMIQAAAESGADFAKFQTWKVSRLTKGEWDEDGRRQIYEKAELSLADHEHLINACHSEGIEFMSSAFSVQDAVTLKDLDCQVVKIPSFECTNHELIDYCVSNFRSTIVSTGTADLEEIEQLTKYNSSSGFHVMHCVSCYPCNIDQINLPRIEYLQTLFDSVGFSDHTSDTTASKVSLEYSPSFIERHFTTDHDLPGRDNKFALLPCEFKELADYKKARLLALKSHGNSFQPSELPSRLSYRGRFNNNQPQ